MRSKWRSWGYKAELRRRKLRLYITLAWAKSVAAWLTVEIWLLKMVHYATGGDPVVVEPEVERGDSNE